MASWSAIRRTSYSTFSFRTAGSAGAAAGASSAGTDPSRYLTRRVSFPFGPRLTKEHSSTIAFMRKTPTPRAASSPASAGGT